MSGRLDGRVVLVGVTGGIAAFKTAQLVSRLRQLGAEVHVLMTAAAASFIAPLTFRTLSGNPVITSLWDPENPYDEPHVVLGERASLYVIAPATAQTLARLALGLADDAVSATALVARAPLLVAPAMHEAMFLHPATQEHLRILRDRGCRIIGPETGWLAAGRKGLGRMSEPETILEEILAVLRAQEG
jgi:phosphopantothenoylcysteine decarboxylase/phosphopantothenate--cysteine ligase